MSETADANWKSLYTIGGAATLVELAGILALIIVQVALGPKPANSRHYSKYLL